MCRFKSLCLFISSSSSKDILRRPKILYSCDPKIIRTMTSCTQNIDATLKCKIEQAANAVNNADVIVIAAGAGMGVDSGLPDFRGPEGLWKAYPPLKKRGLTLPETSNPEWFVRDPKFAWGFFGHRFNLYRKTQPHRGFQILKQWAEKCSDHFIFTSNVDGHFQRSGFPEEKVVECHGSINFLQCFDTRISSEIWPVPDDFRIEVDNTTLQAKVPLPLGPPGKDDQPARPNILMFNDWGWQSDRTDEQESRFEQFKTRLGKQKFVVIEIGAGLYVPTVRYTSEELVQRRVAGTLIRINPRDPEVPRDMDIGLPLGGLKTLELIDEKIKALKD